MDNNKKALTIRFDLGKPHDKYVWNHLHNDKMSYRTMNHAVIGRYNKRGLPDAVCTSVHV